ncbi:hypothetical protein GDO78_014715 [Eleutherodactylus coqui]|uniref:Uncharacterized protein n=1 Tax=Eleutherodactylus coqui TaxID=57060 RepID=A0A8J6JYT3_ELECQ|nr:hypothetical protein GDO78_014715 [Eleutherodactylus coqui]
MVGILVLFSYLYGFVHTAEAGTEFSAWIRPTKLQQSKAIMPQIVLRTFCIRIVPADKAQIVGKIPLSEQILRGDGTLRPNARV